MALRWVISDTHFQATGRSDELGKAGRAALREFLMSIPDGSLILCGDILDLLRASLAEIEAADEDLLALIFRKALVWIVGNHDVGALSFMDGKYRGVPIVERYVEGSTIFMHGHQFDAVNSGWLGPSITRVVDWITDRTTSRVNVWARTIEHWIRSVGRFGRHEDYREKAFEFLKEHSEYTQIVMGHTHKKDSVVRPEGTYVNSGTWINGARGFARLWT